MSLDEAVAYALGTAEPTRAATDSSGPAPGGAPGDGAAPRPGG